MLRFDQLWAKYEQGYIRELMAIESDARKFVVDIISADYNLTQAEHSGMEIDQARKRILQAICSINAVANVEGKGRDDFNT
jgi:uncharacterized hydantoinase/oxoprolinase family protein